MELYAATFIQYKLTVASRKILLSPAAGSSARFKRRQRAVIDMVFNPEKS